jgi:hypothetical protein
MQGAAVQGAAEQGAPEQGAAVSEGTPGSNQESTPRDQFRSSEVSAALKGVRTLKEIYTGREEAWSFLLYRLTLVLPHPSLQSASCIRDTEGGKRKNNKKIFKKFSSCIRKVIHDERPPHIWLNFCAFIPHILYEEALRQI